ncbi:uncharacterized protein LOC132698616 [Cylas formicarius]|uniref:uncharacterized protein LOC132698616 n=1 Tax=Cylas formicarius TaxID=197179 RepID=UPI002958A9E6|nr:uncharacterized protein LOC132698616 [Cylas formicarius]
MVPVKETLDLISAHFRNDVTELFRHCLTTTYFQWNKEFYEQVDGVAMGSPLSPVIANFFMEKFEQQALNTAQKKPKCWFRYVDDTFVIWSHGEKELQIFLAHLNSINNKIKFTMETEKDGRLAFLDVQVERRPNGKLGHKVYRKPTHTERYLNKLSNHHPRQKMGVIKTLMTRANRISEPKYLREEINHLTNSLKNNGYTTSEIQKAMKNRRSKTRDTTEEPQGKVPQREALKLD